MRPARTMRPGRLNVIDAAPLAPRREIEGGRYISRGTLLFNLARLLGCLHTARGETRVCPVCDSRIDWDAKRCNYCQTDLSLFDIDADGDLDTAQVKVPTNADLDDILASIAEGKEVRGDIFETIKSVAKNGAGGDDILAEPAASAAAAEPVKFECPVCGAAVDEDARSCPSCGAEFAEEVVAQFECPVCGAGVDATASACPSCGVTFSAEPEAPPPRAPRTDAGRARPPPVPLVVESGLRERLSKARAARSRVASPPSEADRRALYKELPRLVNEVKPMLLNARRIGVDIEEPKRMINDAIAAGKGREIDRAVALVSQSKEALERSFTGQIASRVESLLDEVEKAKAGGSDVGPVEALLDGSIGKLTDGDFVASSDKANEAREEFERLAGGYHKAKESLRTAEALAEDGRVFDLDVREAERHIRQGREALGRREYDRATQLADQARNAVMKVLPDFLNEEMKRARNKLLDLKVKGGDLTRPIGILKQASIHLKREEYGDAMRFVRMFRRETEAL
ncbi:MAG TPA: zinc ribbon domain-containing protein [Thermoplasmata archaeon]|nr:zinc ribbon domain-containing protein [Thermoplasmata archaeon]